MESRFSQEQETIIVKNAMELTATIMYEQIELEKAEEESFRSKPEAPRRQKLPNPTQVTPNYPPVPKTNYKYEEYFKEFTESVKEKFLAKKVLYIIIIVVATIATMGLVLALPFALAIPVFLFTYYKYLTKRKEINENLENSADYLEARRKAEEEARQKDAIRLEEMQAKQTELNEKYEHEKEKYETEVLPKYESDKATWTVIHNKKIAFLQEEIQYNTDDLNDVYDNSKIISARYRELWILKWLYDDMSSSDHDIRYATELLDRERQRFATEEMTTRTENAINNLSGALDSSLNSIYAAIEQGNALQESTIDILTKTRRDTNVGNIVGIAQRHNTNKMLESLVSSK